MGTTSASLTGPDLAKGVAETQVVEGKPLLGHANGAPVLLTRCGGEVYATSATCTHYGGPLGEGLQVDCEVHCPWHHARFDVRTGRAIEAPAINPLTCYRVERTNGQLRVGQQLVAPAPVAITTPESVVIVGGGAAGHAAAETLRAEGYVGPIEILSADADGPYDRPNLSKDYLAGTAPEEWIPLRGLDFYTEKKIALRTRAEVVGISAGEKTVRLKDGERLRYGALLLAMGAEPVRLALPGADLPHVFALRSLRDCRGVIACAQKAERVVVLGSSFIGMEVAASLRHRGLDVTVVSRDARPFERVLGEKLGDFYRGLHEGQGVKFHLRSEASKIDSREVSLSDGKRLPADLVVMGVGVRPSLGLAEEAGLTVDRGVVVNELLETSAPGIWAAGDIARWPDVRSGLIRVEHWVVAQRQGQTAARNMLGKQQRFDFAPFFWTTQYDVTLNYVGYAETFDEVQIQGSLEKRDARVDYLLKGKRLAVATLGRDLESLRIEAQMEAR
jgi:NADPH-dependent 2,4-dienoyl-CoA reductase/sulfur reductase-like enzyme/nitrite reductase/ring-hydroxylating ferredoxin subunit